MLNKQLSKYVVGASVVAAAIGITGVANAQISLGTAPNFSYASELNYNSAATPAGTPISQPNAVSTPLGFGVSSGQNRYIRYTLTNATFHNPILSTMIQDQTVQVAAGSANSGFGGNTSLTDGITVVSGGAAGSNCVVFQVTGFTGLGGRGNSATDVILLDGANTPSAGNGPLVLDVPAPNSTVTLTYSLHETGTSASCTGGTNANLLSPPVPGPVATFANSLNFSTSVVYTDVADVQFPGLVFGGFVSPASTNGDEVSRTNAGLAGITFQITGINTAAAPHHADGVTNVFLNDLVTAITMTVGPAAGSSADFGSALVGPPNGVTLDTSATCGTSNFNSTLNASKTVATFTLPVGNGTIGNPGGTGLLPDFLCYAVTGARAIPAGAYAASVTLTPVAGVTLETVPSIPVGAIAHNGTQISTPWFTIFPGYTSRFVLTNSGSTDAPYTTAVITESGVTATAGSNASGTVPAGHTLVIDANTVTSAFSAGSRGSVTFNIAAPPQNIMGEYQTFNQSNGSVDTYKLHNTND